jgi:hypothetical protein
MSAHAGYRDGSFESDASWRTRAAGGSDFGFSLAAVTSTTRHAPIGNFNLMSGVVSQGMRFGCGISISGDGVLDLIAIRLSHRGIGQQQSECNGK